MALVDNQTKKMRLLAICAFSALHVVGAQPLVCKPRNKTVVPATPIPTPVDPPGYGPLFPWSTPSPSKAPVVAPTDPPYASPTKAPYASPTKAPYASPTVPPTSGGCPQYILDFYDVDRGEYITDELEEKWGVTIKAKYRGNGFTPDKKGKNNSGGGAARVFDSALPGRSQSVGDLDMGSPHMTCGGPGQGGNHDVGYLGSGPSENCVPQGKVLIVQEKNNDMQYPDDNGSGGELTFTFTRPVDVDWITVFDGETSEAPKYMYTYSNGAKNEEDSPAPGDNGVRKDMVNKKNVKEVTFSTKGSGGLSEIAYTMCPWTSNLTSTLDVPTVSRSCPLVNLNFERNNTNDDRVGTNKGWVGTYYLGSHHVNITAYPADLNDGWALKRRARIFETHFARDYNRNQDLRVSGVHHVLIIAKKGTTGGNKDEPAPKGGGLRFKFTNPVYLESVSILNTRTTSPSNKKPKYYVMKADRTVVDYPASVTGAKTVKTDSIGEDSVRELWFISHDPSAVVNVAYRNPC